MRRGRGRGRCGELRLLDAEGFGELAGVEHLLDDVGAADQLAVDVELREGLPVGDLGGDFAQRLQGGEDVDRAVVDVDLVEEAFESGELAEALGVKQPEAPAPAPGQPDQAPPLQIE